MRCDLLSVYVAVGALVGMAVSLLLTLYEQLPTLTAWALRLGGGGVCGVGAGVVLYALYWRFSVRGILAVWSERRR